MCRAAKALSGRHAAAGSDDGRSPYAQTARRASAAPAPPRPLDARSRRPRVNSFAKPFTRRLQAGCKWRASDLPAGCKLLVEGISP